jgi:hypothetical protein
MAWALKEADAGHPAGTIVYIDPHGYNAGTKRNLVYLAGVLPEGFPETGEGGRCFHTASDNLVLAPDPPRSSPYLED